MRVAVLLAAYNGLKYIEEQISSIVRQENVELKLFISVDYSTDLTYSMCKLLESKYSNVSVLPYGDVYASATRNFFRLIQEVNFDDFDYISLSDQDDIWMPEKISRALSVLVNSNSSCYSSDVFARWENGKIKLLKKSYQQRRWDYFFESAGPGCTYVFDRKFALRLKEYLQKNELFLKSLGGGQHDWFIYAFARKNNFQWFIDDRVGMYYRQHSGNLVGANYGFHAFIYRLKLVLSGWGFRQALLISDALTVSNGDNVIHNLRSGRIGFLRLGLKSMECRRRVRDQFYFGVACLLMFLMGRKL